VLAGGLPNQFSPNDVGSLFKNVKVSRAFVVVMRILGDLK
jgi:hypothetical protein